MTSTTLPSIELPPEDGTFGFFLNYNGEPAFAVQIENLPDLDVGRNENSKERKIAIMTVHPMPILGGETEATEIILYAEGKS